MRHVKKFLFFIIILLTISCNNEREEVNTTIHQFYKNYSGNFRTINKGLLSIKLQDYIIQANDIEVIEMGISKIENSDKSNCIKEDIFSSFSTINIHFIINDIKFKNDKAFVNITLEDKKSKQIWNDSIELIDENGWKINNVFFDKKYKKNKMSTQKILINYIHH